jgi:hypothetical protein
MLRSGYFGLFEEKERKKKLDDTACKGQIEAGSVKIHV